MLTNTKFEHELSLLIKAEIEAMRDVLETNPEVSEIARGRILALRQVMDSFFEQVNRKLNER